MSDVTTQVLGERYEIRERLGAGGMARVFKAWDKTLEREVAVKVLYEHLAEDHAFVERFTREAKLAAGLSHPSIVQIYDYNHFSRDDAPVCYMVMRYVPGETLRSLMERLWNTGERMVNERILEITAEICDALNYAHSRGVIHRDVKPGNILIDEQGHAVLSDFGIARIMETTRLTQDGATTGTPAYMSPEQATGQGGDARSDLYSLGVIVFELLTGQLPYTDDGGVSLALKHMSAPIPKVSEFLRVEAPQIDLFFERALAKQPNLRFTSADVLYDALADALRANPAERPLRMETPLPQSVKDYRTPPITGVLNDATIVPLAAPRPRKTHYLPWIAAIVAIIATAGIWVVSQQSGAGSAAAANLVGADIETIEELADLPDPFFTHNFDLDEPETQYWPVGEANLFSRIVEDGVYRLRNDDNNAAKIVAYEAYSDYTDINLSMVAAMQPDSGPAAAFGLVFRYQDEDNFYVFAIDNAQQFSIWAFADGEWDELRPDVEKVGDWTFSEFINRPGEQNRLRVTADETIIRGYVNNQPVAEVIDERFTTGGIGVYLATGATPPAIVEVDQLEVYRITPSMTDSPR